MKVWSWRDAVTQADLEPNTKYILLVLSLYMDERGGSCYPTIDTLVKDSSLARGTVIKHLNLAEEAGFILRRRHGFKGQEWANNEYAAAYPAHAALIKPDDTAEKGGSTIEPPSPQECETKGSPTIELPFQAEAGPTGEPRQSNGEEKAVQPLDSNTTLNTPITHQQQDAGAPARVDDADDDEFIKIFDEERRGAFGENHIRHARIDDPDIAHGFRKSGCSPEFFREVVRAKLTWMAGRDVAAPGGLVYFRDIIPAEMKRAGARARTATPPAPPLEQIVITLTSLGGDTPENRLWLAVLERLRVQHGDAMFRSWLAPLRIREKTANGLFLIAPTAFMAQYINNVHIDAIRKCVTEMLPEISILKVEPQSA